MSDTGGEDFTVDVGIRPDTSEMDALGDRLARELREAGVKGSADFNRVLARTLDTLRRNLGKSLGTLGPELADAGRKATKTLKGAADEAGRMREDIKAMSLLLEAQQNNKLIDPNQFALLRRIQAQLLETQRTIAKTNFSDPAQVRALRSTLDAQRRLVNSANITFQSAVKQSTATIIEEERRRTQAQRSQSALRLNAERTAATQASAIVRREQDQILVATQRAARQRVQITRFALESLGRAEKAFGALVTGIARTSSSAVSRLYGDSLGRVSSLIRRQSSQINSITRSSSSERTSILRSSFRSQERLVQQSMTRQTEIIRQAQSKAQTGLVGAASRSSVLGLGGGLAGLGVLSLGIERFSNLERLTKQFTVLTGSAEDAATVLAQVKEFARNTPFDLVGVADLAKGFLAIKTPVDQVLPRVKAIADAVALTGGGVDALNRIQRAIGQVVSAGRLQGDELNQLAENLPGLNIREILAKQLTGGDQAALNAMQEAGELSADSFVNALITGLSTDPRLVGASEDLAKTLGGRLANFREVIEDVGASFIGLIATPFKEGIRLATVALDGLSQFIKGEISPAMHVLRTAVGGAASAIGLLLVAKVAGEALKILATSAKLLLTPFGIIVAAVGALGAAFAVLRDRSEEFREVTDRLGRLLGTTFGNVFRAIGDQVERVRDAFAKAKEPISGTADALERSLKPARTFISEIGTRLAGAIATAGRFLTETLIPAVGDFVIFIGKNAGPAIRSFIDQLKLVIEAVRQFAAPYVTTALDKLKEGLAAVRKIGAEVFDTLVAAAKGSATGMKIALSPIAKIIEGFKNIRKNLGPELLGIGAAALGGGLIAGPIGALVAGAATAFATLSPTIRGFIVDGFKDAVDSVKGIFNNIDWAALAIGATEFVRAAGRIIGTIVSSPEFVAGLAAIAAAAVAVAAQFVRGFAEGVIGQLQRWAEIGGDIVDAIYAGIGDFITNNPLDLVGILIAGSTLAAFTAAGLAIGKAIASGMSGGLSQIRTNASGGGDFLSATLFGQGGPNAFIRRSVQTATQANDEIRRQLSTLSRGRGRGPVLAVGGLTDADIASVKSQIGTLEGAIGSAALAGLRFRTAIADTFSNIRTNSNGIRGVFSSITTGIGDAAAAVKGQGKAIGAALGVGIAGAFGSAISGQQLGSGNIVGGLGGILSSALATGFVAGPIVGAAVGGLGLITAAFTANQQAAKAAAEQVAFYRDVLVDLSGNSKDAAEEIRKAFGEQIRKELPATIAAIADAGITTQTFLDIVSLAPDKFGAFQSALDDIEAGAYRIRGGGGAAAEGIAAVQAALDSLPAGPARDAITELVTAFENGDISAKTFKEALDLIRDETGEFVDAQGNAADIIKITGENASTTTGNLNSLKGAFDALTDSPYGGKFLNDAVAAPIPIVEDLRDVLGEAQAAVDKLLNPTAGTLQEEIGNTIIALEGIAGSIGGGLDVGGILGGAEVQAALTTLRGNMADVVKEGLEDGASEAEIDNALSLLTATIDKLEVPEETKALMRAEVEKAINADVIPVDVTAVANTESAQQAARDLVGAAEGEISGDELDSSGREVGAGFASGIRSKLESVRSAVKALTDAATLAANVNLDISSPSRVFEGIGSQTAEGFEVGILNALDTIAAAGTTMGDTFREATMASLEQLNNDIAALAPNLFDSLFAGGSDRDSALRGVQGSLRSFTEDLAGPLQEAIENGLPKNFLIDFGAGLDNRNALADLVAGLKEFGAGLLRSGASAEETQAAVLLKRDEALNIAAFLGFDRTVVEAFFDQLGLSVTGLQQFGTKLAEETEALKVAAAAEEAQRRKDESDAAAAEASDAAATEPTIGELNVNLALPFGDPEAIALSVANSAVTALRTR